MLIVKNNNIYLKLVPLTYFTRYEKLTVKVRISAVFLAFFFLQFGSTRQENDRFYGNAIRKKVSSRKDKGKNLR